jgi:hypothetical protein
MSYKFDLSIFNYTPIKVRTFRAIICGGTGSGKTYYLMNTLWPEISRRYPAPKDPKETSVYIFAPDFNEKMYRGFIPHAIIISNPELFVETLHMIRIKQERNIIGYNKITKEPVYKFPILCIFDDVIDSKFVKSNAINLLYSSFRHFDVSVFWLTQNPEILITGVMKNNTDLFFIFRQNNRRPMNIMAQFLEAPLDAILKANHYRVSDKVLEDLSRKVMEDEVMNKRFGKLIVDTVENKVYVDD